MPFARARTLTVAVVVCAFGLVPETAGQGVPANIAVQDEGLRVVLMGLLAVSKTFRSECAILNRTDSLTVVIRRGDSSLPFVTTRLDVRPYDTGTILAAIDVPPTAPWEAL